MRVRVEAGLESAFLLKAELVWTVVPSRLGGKCFQGLKGGAALAYCFPTNSWERLTGQSGTTTRDKASCLKRPARYLVEVVLFIPKI